MFTPCYDHNSFAYLYTKAEPSLCKKCGKPNADHAWGNGKGSLVAIMSAHVPRHKRKYCEVIERTSNTWPFGAMVIVAHGGK